MSKNHPYIKLIERNINHETDKLRACIGTKGWTLYEAIEALPQKSLGSNNVLIGSPRGVQVDISDGDENAVIVPPIRNPQLLISIAGSRNLIVLPSSVKIGGRIIIEGDDNLIFFGESSTCNKGNFVMRSDRQSIIIGDDCMISYDVSVRNGDMHGIFDLNTLEIINYPESILISPHVWLAEGCTILKGTKIGEGAIVGARALVSSDVSAKSLVVGVPSKVIRSGVSWTRKRDPAAREIHSIKKMLSDGI